MLQHGFQIQVQRFDILPQLRQMGSAPAVKAKEHIGVLVRKHLGDPNQRVKVRHASLTVGDHWLILQEKLPPADRNDLRWSLNKSDPQVFVPMFDYLLPDADPMVLVHFGAQTGALAMALLPQELRVSKMFLAVGNVLQRPDGQPGYQVWIGFAAVTEKG